MPVFNVKNTIVRMLVQAKEDEKPLILGLLMKGLDQFFPQEVLEIHLDFLITRKSYATTYACPDPNDAMFLTPFASIIDIQVYDLELLKKCGLLAG